MIGGTLTKRPDIVLQAGSTTLSQIQHKIALLIANVSPNILLYASFQYSPLIPHSERLDLTALHQPQSGVFSYVQQFLQLL